MNYLINDGQHDIIYEICKYLDIYDICNFCLAWKISIDSRFVSEITKQIGKDINKCDNCKSHNVVTNCYRCKKFTCKKCSVNCSRCNLIFHKDCCSRCDGCSEYCCRYTYQFCEILERVDEFNTKRKLCFNCL